MISSRHHQSMSYIDGSNRGVYWELEGRRNAFKDLSGGKAMKL